MKKFAESLFFCAIVFLTVVFSEVDIIPTQEQVEYILVGLGIATFAFLLGMLEAFCFRKGGITFARFGRTQISMCRTNR